VGKLGFEVNTHQSHSWQKTASLHNIHAISFARINTQTLDSDLNTIAIRTDSEMDYIVLLDDPFHPRNDQAVGGDIGHISRFSHSARRHRTTIQCFSLAIAQNPLHTFPRNFPVDGEVANVLPIWHQVVLMEFGKRHDPTDTTDFCCRQLVTDLLRTCYLETGIMDVGPMDSR